MKTLSSQLLCLFLCSFSTGTALARDEHALPSHPAPNGPSVTAAEAARGVLERFIGPRASEFVLDTLPRRPDGHPVYELRAEGGKVVVRGTSGTAICRGAYDYLRTVCGCLFTWGGRQVVLPVPFPDLSPRRVVSPNQFVLQDNICAFGYTTAFYGWPEWERYLDWSALHGCNFMMAPVGSEAIWQRVWRRLGVSEEALAHYFTGPAFLPWHRMGNVNGHDGPLPASWHERSVALQKKILARMRSLGIEPIAPAFSGFVPPELGQSHPQARIIHLAPWAGFPAQHNTHILHPLSPLYPRIGGAFIKEWKREFGPARYFQADSFNELQVPVPENSKERIETLARFGKAVYDAIRAGEPDGVWVMMGWLFFNARDFWDKGSAAALLSRVPDDRMIILDLYCEKGPLWRKHDAFYGKQWIDSVIPNWGGNSQLGGDLPFYAQEIPRIAGLKETGRRVGFGLSPEGTENNEVVFELVTDAAWARRPLELSKWLDGYVRARYGTNAPALRKAWDLFAGSVYAEEVHHPFLFQSRPGGGSWRRGQVKAGALFEEGVKTFLEGAAESPAGALLTNDAIEFAVQYAGVQVDRRLADGLSAIEAGERSIADACMDQAFHLLDRIDALLAAHTLFRLDRWVKMARACGTTPADKDFYEEDAKRQITVWGGPMLSEYAARVWSGLVGGYYAARWQAWYQARRAKKPFDLHRWEEHWITTPGVTMPAPPPDPLGEARQIVEETSRWKAGAVKERLLGELIGSWHSGELSETFGERDWDVTAQMEHAGPYSVLFRYQSGAHRLDIAWAALLEDGREIARDEHAGTTGIRNEGNRYRLELETPNKSARYTLRASVKTAGGRDSSGEVRLAWLGALRGDE